jgi:hypothetical protein
MIVRSLGEVALELWPREKMVEMVNQKRERVRELFLVPNSEIVENPVIGDKLGISFGRWI